MGRVVAMEVPGRKSAWAVGVRARLGLLIIAVGALLVAACSPSVPTEEGRALPGRAELVRAIAQFGEPFPEFDQLRAVVVATEDDIVFEEYYETDANAYWGMQSVTKSVVSTLVGIALAEGLIEDLDATLAEMLPSYAESMSPQTAGITLRQLLTMTAGFPTGEAASGPDFVDSRDWVRHILTHPELPPGERFQYSNGTSHLLSAVLSEATGVSALEYARSRLFDPLGIDTRPALVRPRSSQSPEEIFAAYDRADFSWPADPQGVSTGWWGLRLRPRDMVRIGQLFLSGGRWDGEQLVPEDWVEQATSEQVDADMMDAYGFQWWVDRTDGEHSFQAIGYGGQQIVVVPGRALVVVLATQVLQADPSSRGIDNQVLTALVADTIVSRFPAP